MTYILKITEIKGEKISPSISYVTVCKHGHYSCTCLDEKMCQNIVYLLTIYIKTLTIKTFFHRKVSKIML